MSIFDRIKNLRKVTSRLGSRKFARAKEIIEDYGVGELLRRTGEKMQSGDVPSGRLYVITNESYLRTIKNPRGYIPVQSVSFTILPGALNVGKLEILTQDSGQGRLQLEAFDEDGKRLLETHTEDVADGDYSCFEFLPLLNPHRKKITFTITHTGNSGGILLHPNKNKRGFDVKGGGRLVCRIYTRLDALYLHWLKNNTPTADEQKAQRQQVFDYTPKISVAVPLYNTEEYLLREMIQSLMDQTYSNWELCLGDGSTGDTNLAPIVEGYQDDRIRYVQLGENKGISGNTNAAIELATGDYVGLLDHDDRLMPHAIYSYIAKLNKDRSYDFIYSDEDKISADSTRRFDPFFKPDFSPNMLLSFNYITHFSVIKKSLLDRVGWLRSEYDGAQDYDLYLRATEAAQNIGHIDDILYNWRIIETSTAFSSSTKSYTVDAGKKAVEAAIERRNLEALVEMGPLPNYYNVVYDIPHPYPKVSIIIPNHNERATLKKCVDSILKKTSYPNFELVIVENNSTDDRLFRYYETLQKNERVQLLTWDHPFNFAALNNYAAQHASGDILLFMNNDMSVMNADWLEQMVMHACRKDIGAVGAKLFYPDDTVQHGGIVLRIGGVAGHSHKFSGAHEVGSFARMAIVHDVSAVTGACTMTRADVFKEVDGFDEQFTVAYNDVDLSLKIREKGYSVLFTPHAQLYHYESKTRGYEDTPDKKERLAQEAALWKSKWEDKYPVDPFYNRNLTHIFEDYSINPNRIKR